MCIIQIFIGLTSTTAAAMAFAANMGAALKAAWAACTCARPGVMSVVVRDERNRVFGVWLRSDGNEPFVWDGVGGRHPSEPEHGAELKPCGVVTDVKVEETEDEIRVVATAEVEPFWYQDARERMAGMEEEEDEE